MEEDADPGEPPKFSVKRPESEAPTQGEGNALDTGHTETEDRQAEKPARPKRRNPRLTSDNQYGPHNPGHLERLQVMTCQDITSGNPQLVGARTISRNGMERTSQTCGYGFYIKGFGV